MTGFTSWDEPDAGLRAWIEAQRARMLAAYVADPALVREHAAQEDSFRTGGYSQRQVLELVQNAADALRRSHHRGRVEVAIVGDMLYCANEGAPFTREGLEAVTHAYLSDKRGDDIGRFGLGFKSILGVTDAPLVLSRSVSFSFSAQSSRQVLAEIAPTARRYPVLRLPALVDATAEMDADPVLAEFGSWAQTIVRLPLVGDVDRLIEGMRSFPREFMLFAPFVSKLAIRLADDGAFEFGCEQLDDHRYRLTGVDGIPSDWMVWHRGYRPSEEALAEVSETTRRPEVTLSYAAPLDDTQQLGRFWAYFPLLDTTSARGVFNAPWQVTDDRTNLLPGRFNDELLEVAADLLVSSLPYLNSAEDPARHFDYMPARGRETDNFGDHRLTELVPVAAAATACVPDAAGVLRSPAYLTYPNTDLHLEYAGVKAWSDAPGRPHRSPHPTCYRTPTRRARMRRLVRGDLSQPASNEIDASQWLEHLVSDASDEQCRAALRVLFTVGDDALRRELRRAAVIPDSAGTLARLDAVRDIFLHGDRLSASVGIRLVRHSFVALPEVEDQLRTLGFTDVDPRLELRRLSEMATGRWSAPDWHGFWDLVGRINNHDAREILTEHVARGAALKVLCRDGSWQHVSYTVVPGLVDPIDESVAIDSEFHRDHLNLLRAIGVTMLPVVSAVVAQDPTQLEYRRLQRVRFVEDLGVPHRDRGEIDFVEREGLGPLHVLRRFADSGDEQARMTWTRELLGSEVPEVWTLNHPNPKRFPAYRVTAPHLWASQTYGLLDTAWGPRQPHRSLNPGMSRMAPLMPVAVWAVAAKLETIADLKAVPADMWREFLDRIPTGGDPHLLGDLISVASRGLPPDEKPTAVPAVRGIGYDSVAPTELLIAVTEQEIRTLVELNLPFVAVEDEGSVESLHTVWGCRAASGFLRVEIVPEEPGEAVALLDRFRRLRDYARGALDDFVLIACSSVSRVVTLSEGMESHPERFAVDRRAVYFERILDADQLLAEISGHFSLHLSDADILLVLQEAESERVQTAIAQARALTDPADKLLALLPVSVLEAALPSGLLSTIRASSADTGDRGLAELVLHVHGHNALHRLRRDLADNGFDVPDTWAGSGPAIAFVRRLGFPAEFAGERGRQLDSDVTVLGPPDLKPLHPYQRELAVQIRRLVCTAAEPERALLFLPTGAGKTRVTVEALVETIRARELGGPVLWIAQSEELCEQAVQSWITVWRLLGNRPLRLCRLWGDNEITSGESDAEVIVATDAKLDRIRARSDYDWLLTAAAVVVDEAHGATAPGITATLQWLGINSGETARPLLGLTATPFHGNGKTSNEVLAALFDNRRLNVLGEDPYGELQRLGVLAEVRHRVLPGSSYSFDVSEREHITRYDDVPNTVLDRVGRDHERTMRLVDDICELPHDWPTLVFASSVLAATTLSALLRLRGRSSATISGSTSLPERRRTIEAFRQGGIQVLTNCNVLTQGFDAPGVRALYIARPTFSPNTYIQMVGRALRGPLNGGEPECLVVNVADTFEAFGEGLAYREYDHLWQH
ncbi:sacsin N-terminal ATP-binding-like domain-containing protein [Actinoplanes couchii]|uniref:Superfamily II DNA or RNA helicase n=1 Tax=Actinoplanes couchii TaxID=403638 RepID=A0ABQ3XIC3_9ACTN|nr:DEAD/DEAH box helicase family protein [Actinoplanes couchii]MDR6324691.1 superfamily II DNA or RNA helicase [Actinoplanes couchii]GID58246.1 hypothetical protein Aco03nite_066500 [Actinoplanes couchii]